MRTWIGFSPFGGNVSSTVHLLSSLFFIQKFIHWLEWGLGGDWVEKPGPPGS